MLEDQAISNLTTLDQLNVELKNFVNSIMNRKDPLVTGEDGLAALDAANKIEEDGTELMILSIIAFIIVFSIVILAHEFGHYFFSRSAGIKILELGLGFGPRVAGFVKNQTLYTLNILPLGGFIRIAGTNPEEETNDDQYSAE